MDLAALVDRLERISVGYAAREGIDRDDDWFLHKLVEELAELTQMQLARTGRSKDRGFTPERLDERLAEECADVLGHVLLFARPSRFAHPRATWCRWEESRPVHPHGAGLADERSGI